MKCMSCGLSITGTYHDTKFGAVCESCWNDPNLFFAERIQNDHIMQKIRNVFSINDEETITISTIKLKQKNIILYSGKLSAKDLLKLYAVLSFEEENLGGYQRELYDDQINELSQYLLDCPTALIPGLFVSIRDEAYFKEKSGDFGELILPLRKGSLWIIDGQHRISSFEKIFASFGASNQNIVKVSEILEFEIPVTFIDTKNAISNILPITSSSINAEDIERVAFYIINKTQRRLSPSLTDTLQYCISRAGINGIPVIEKNKWRTEAAAIGIEINSDNKSALYQKINISGQRGLNRPFQLNSFISSLKPLFQNGKFNDLTIKDKKNFLLMWWNNIKHLNEKGFLNESYRDYLILKSIGVYTLNLLALDYIETCKNNFMHEKYILSFLKNIKNFDWNKDTSPLANYGGMKGVREARKKIHEYVIKQRDG